MPGSERFVQSSKDAKVTGSAGPPHMESNVTCHGPLIVKTSFVEGKLLFPSGSVLSALLRNTMKKLCASSNFNGMEVLSLIPSNFGRFRMVPVTGSQSSGCIPDMWKLQVV